MLFRTISEIGQTYLVLIDHDTGLVNDVSETLNIVSVINYSKLNRRYGSHKENQ
jgi:hypothetical protein